ncbi:hypothetical protein BGZ47_010561 [Haplosporangium gracile]|nr:hypothetical protein BGZ47_010561 [Haplosporangium gracile]
MSRQQQLVRQFMSLNLTRKQLLHISSSSTAILTKPHSWILVHQQQPVSRFHLSARIANGQSQRAVTSVAEASSSAPTRGPQSSYKASKPDTRRKAQRPNTTTTTTTSPPKDQASQQTKSATGQVRLNRTMDSKEVDKEILRLVRANTAWKDIDAALNLPHSKAHHRYHTHLDPALKAWKLPNGQPNLALQDRLVYLVEVEKLSFAQIEKYRLMYEPWKTPTAFAPTEVLEAAGVTLESPEAGAEGAAVTEDSSGDRPRKNSGGPFNRVRLQWKYNSLKSVAAANTLRENEHLIRRAIQRSVELYGENWKAVAAHADSLLDQWIKPALPRNPLTPTKVATEFRNFQRTGVDWGLEDDVVMTRKILALSQNQSDILHILTKPFSENGQQSKQGVALDQEQQRQHWTEISVAVGSHSPVQCQRRWKGLWNLHDDDKSAQSKSWHRFERFQYWMLWKYFNQQKRDMDGTKLMDTEALQAACEELSHSKEIARWMRHRTEAQCRKFFRSSIRSVLNPSQDKLATMPNTIVFVPSSSPTASTSQIRLFESKESLANAIIAELVDPLLIKMSVVSAESKDSTRGDHQQPLVRSEWTPDRIRTLNEIIVQEKQGVQRADFELDWDKIAQALEQRYAAGSSDALSEATTATSTRSLIVPQPSLPFTAKQCQSCWEYISTIPTGNKSAATSTSSDSSTTATTTTLEGKKSAVQGWSENELLLLQQGVRKHGTLWADIRAQFLPKKDISDLQRAWFSISGPSPSRNSDQGGAENNAASAAAVDRLSEPDYVGLLSALDKVGGGSSSAGGKDK